MDTKQHAAVLSIQDLVEAAHRNALEKGFWTVNKDVGNKVALIHSELSEFFEAYRRDIIKPDEHCPKFTNITIELADVLIRVFDLAGAMDIPLGEAVLAKMEYNQSRPYLHGKKF